MWPKKLSLAAPVLVKELNNKDMTSEFQKALDLIKKTGDKLVFYDAGNDNTFVVLPIDDYQKLLFEDSSIAGLTEEQLLAKINRDIARWREEQQLQKMEETEVEETLEVLAQTEPPVEVKTKTEKTEKEILDESADDIYQFEPIEEEQV